MKKLLRAMVADLDAWIVECANGEEACRLFEQHRPDWVLMDIEMKRINGIAATRQLLAAFPEARVVIVTNCGDEPLRQAAREAGACGYVLKENLLALRELISKPQATFDSKPSTIR